jgi:hypothetical protein
MSEEYICDAGTRCPCFNSSMCIHGVPHEDTILEDENCTMIHCSRFVDITGIDIDIFCVPVTKEDSNGQLRLF